MLEERRIAEAMNRARLELIAAKSARTNRMMAWATIIITLVGAIYPVYKDYKDADTAADILSVLGTSGEQLRKDLIAVQAKHQIYETQISNAEKEITNIIQDIAIKHLKIDGTFTAIDIQINNVITNIKDLQVSVTKLNNDLIKQETLIDVLRGQLRVRRTDYEGSPQ